MKKLFYILIPALLSITACKNGLDTEPTNFYTQDTYWSTSKQALEGLTGCYQVLASTDFYGGSTPHRWEAMTPNAYNYSNGHASNDFARGIQTGTTLGMNNNLWNGGYKGIGRCNTVIDKVSAMDIDAVLKSRIIGEAKFLRAFFYDKMNVVFGGVPLILSTPDINSHSSLPRNTYEEVLNQILKDLSDAEAALPVSYPASDAGRATKGAALALTARVQLQDKKYPAVVTTIDKLFALNKYSLYSNYNGLFRKANSGNSEIIFDVRFKAPESTHEYDLVMAQYSTQAPLKSLIDVYQMTDGKSIQESTLYNPADPYKNRDPRFAQTILYLGAPWRNRTATSADLHQTGFSFRKFTEYNATTAGTITNSDLNYIVIRYADVLLMYAEAANEVNGPTAAVYNRVNEVRKRPTVNMPELPAGLSKEEMRQAIRLERRIEMAGEMSYFYDIRRWGTIETEMVGPIKDHAGNTIQTRSFDPQRDYLWPIPYTEIDLNPALKQNPKY